MADLISKIMLRNKIRNYWDIQREVIGTIDQKCSDMSDDDRAAVYDAIIYGIKMAHNHGYEKGYQLARREQIRGAFND